MASAAGAARGDLVGSLRKPAQAWTESLGVLAIALFAVSAPIVVHLYSHPLAIGLCALAAFLIANYLPAILPAVLVFAYFFQNSIVSLVSPWIAGLDDFNSIRGYSFLATAVAWLVVSLHYWGDRRRFEARFRALMNASSIAVALACLYFAYGLATVGSPAIIYLRNIVGPLFLFQTFGIVAQRCELRFDGPLRLMAVLMLVAGYTELLFRDEWLSLLNAQDYWTFNTANMHDSGAWVKEMRTTGRVPVDLKDFFEVDLFNSPLLADLNLHVLRLAGPNFHPISFGYALSFLILYMAVWGGRLFIVLAVPLLVFVSAKGAVVLVVATLTALACTKLYRGTALLLAFAAALAAYALAAIVTGLNEGDYHVAGFFGGIAGFLANPLGHGLGAGGNLTTDFSRLDWDKAQALGQSASAVESAVGVLLFQMGVGGLVLLAVYGRILWRAWTDFLATQSRACAMLAFALGAMLVNGIFQEEALFAPLALALLAGLAGLVLGSGEADREAT